MRALAPALISTNLARKAYDRVSTKVRGLPLWLRDRRRATYALPLTAPEGGLRRHLAPFDLTPEDRTRVLFLADQFIQHRFNVLGSGWRDWNSTVPFAVSPGNRARSLELRAHLPSSYQAIDWHRDFKSGSRFDPNTWFQNIRRAQAGVDAKVPWELARFHHFHVLARAFAYTGLGGFEREIENQFYDFVSANPPRFGVNWSSAMDVAIRAANWLIAVDIAQALGAEFSATFERDLKTAVWEHGQHLMDHLESSSSDRANHYLSNLCGLIVIASYLPSDPGGWMDFAVREWTVEVQRQFLNDGGSFEGSTCYHRLSAEMSFYAATLQTACGRQIDPLVLERLAKAARFTAGVMKPNGFVPQIGDNDSGRFLNLGAEEESLDHRHLVVTADIVFGRSEIATGFEATVLRGFLRGRHYSVEAETGPEIEAEVPPHTERPDFDKMFADAPDTFKRACVIPLGQNGGRPFSMHAWPDFGLYAWKGAEFFLSVRCDRREHLSMEGHCHNDVFSLDLQIAGQDVLRDPGSLVYAPQPLQRNLYRSLAVHFPSLWLSGLVKETLTHLLFTFPDRVAGEVLKYSPTGFFARAKVRRGWFYLQIEITDKELKIRAVAPEAIQAPCLPDIEFSPSYGCLSGAPSYVVASVTAL